MRDWIRAREFWAIPAVVVVAFAVLVYLAFGVSHTKTVTRTKVVTETLVKQAAAPKFDGSLSQLVAFLHPTSGKQVKCAKSFPADSACFQLGSSSWFVFFAAPSAAAS